MVEWSEFKLNLDGVAELDKQKPAFGIICEILNLIDQVIEKKKETTQINQSYLNKINEILTLAVSYSGIDTDPIVRIRAIRDRYAETKILTKQDMKTLNGLWNVFTFEQRFHPDKETTIGIIKKLLGEHK